MFQLLSALYFRHILTKRLLNTSGLHIRLILSYNLIIHMLLFGESEIITVCKLPFSDLLKIENNRLFFQISNVSSPFFTYLRQSKHEKLKETGSEFNWL